MTLTWHNGSFTEDMSEDSGLTNGIGVFDTLLVADGEAQDAELHFARLRRDCETVLRIPAPALDWNGLACDLITHARLTGPARLRTLITGGELTHPLAVPTRPHVTMTIAPCIVTKTPLACVIVPAYPRLASCVLENAKRTDYTRAYAARQDALASGADEAILINTAGTIACAATSNIFIVENRRLITPPLADGALAGITRAKFLANGASEDTIPVARLMLADSVFLTNSITGPRPVASINGQAFRLPQNI